MKVKLDKGAFLPKRAHFTDAGYDLKAVKGRFIRPGSTGHLDTGVHVELPKKTVGYIKSRSSMYSKGLITDGTIDEGYTGSIKVVLHNIGRKTQIVRRGDKIAQLVIHPIETPNIEIVSKLENTERGDGGFGSTGV